MGWLWLLTAALLQAAAAGEELAAAPKVPPPSSEHRVIVRFADTSNENSGTRLDEQAERIAARAGVRSALPLRQLGMIVAVCESVEAQEALIGFLDTDSEVELAVPDTPVTLTTAPQGSLDAILAQALSGLPPRCSAHPACHARGLQGDCCPAGDGTVLSCCTASEPSRIALRTYHGAYLAVDAGGAVTGSGGAIDAASTFRAVLQPDGNVSLQVASGGFVCAEPSGALRASRDRALSWETFRVLKNANGTVSLQAFGGRYVSAAPDGGVSATRDSVSLWEQFQLVDVPAPGQRFPDDPSFPELWGMHSYANNDIDAPEAWRVWTGELGAPITVGIVDTGIDYRHDDLKEQMWVNPNEIPGNGIDDDENGYVDDIHGADFANQDGDPWDDQMHGSHCSGTIAGVGNNGLGVTGVAWRGVRLMALKFLTATGAGQTSDAIKAIDYGIAHGAKILSNSWGGGGSNSALRVAIERSEAAGILFVAAAGNSGTDNDEDPHYPSNYEVGNIISVASTTVSGSLSSFSCFGNRTVHLAAPGSNIYSTVPGQAYESLSGTSMATPHVTGLASLVWTYRPSLSMQQVKSILLESVERQDWLKGKVSTEGMINAKNALETAWAFQPPTPPAHAPRGVQFVDGDTKVGTLGGVVTIFAAADESDVEYYRVHFVSTAGFQIDALGQKVLASGAQTYSVEINGSIAAPQFAKYLVAVSGRASGEQPARLGTAAPSVVLEDIGVPDFLPKSVAWGGDTDLRHGFINGTLRVRRAQDEHAISQYNIYWHTPGGPRGALLGSIPAAGFLQPSCSGDSCGLIASSVLDDGAYRFSRGSYGDEESATISASGPAVVTVRRCDTEHYYDWLSVGSQRLTGNLADTLPMDVNLPEGPFTITWFSDASIHAGGWSFDLKQLGAEVGFQVQVENPPAAGLEVTPAYHRTELPNGTVVAVGDWTRDMVPSRAFAPQALAFADADPRRGFVAGVAQITPKAGSQEGGVTSYVVSFAARSGAPIGKGWEVPAGAGGAALNVSVPPTDVPPNATKLVARAKNAHGVGLGSTFVRLRDRATNAAGMLSEAAEGEKDEDEGAQEAAAVAELSQPPLAPPAAAAAKAKEPWLPQPSSAEQDRPVVVWTATDDEEHHEFAAVARHGLVRSSVVVPGLNAHTASAPGMRAALARAVAAALPESHGATVRVVRVSHLTQARAAHVGPGGRRLSAEVEQALGAHPRAAAVDFEVAVLTGSSAVAGLDRIEARLILLSLGGPAAARFDAALAAELRAAGAGDAELGFARSRVGEPQQLGPRLAAASLRPSKGGELGRKLEGVAVETMGEERTEDEEARAVMLGMTTAAAMAASAAVLALAFALRRRGGAQRSDLASRLAGVDGDEHASEPFESIAVRGEGQAAPVQEEENEEEEEDLGGGVE